MSTLTDIGSELEGDQLGRVEEGTRVRGDVVGAERSQA
jgi:hypothetical protein